MIYDESGYDKHGFNKYGLHKNGTYLDDEGFAVNGYNIRRIIKLMFTL